MSYIVTDRPDFKQQASELGDAMLIPAVDRGELARFIDALFRYADPVSFVSLRTFRDDISEAWRRDLWRIVPAGDQCALVDAADELATAAANADVKVVFCPPICTFITESGADTANVADGLVLTVECDENAAAARETLEDILGPATVIVASGGRDANGEAKLHLHWRLGKVARDNRHADLKELRSLACKLVGADHSGVPLVHPLRWPGSWHRKGEPVMAKIVELNDCAEIDLDVTLAKLRARCPEDNVRHNGNGDGTAPIEDIRSAFATMTNEDLPWEDWNRLGMAGWRASEGSEEGFEAFNGWSRKSTKYDAAETRARWDHFPHSPPNQIGAGTLFHLAREADPGWRPPSLTAQTAAETFKGYVEAEMAKSRVVAEEKSDEHAPRQLVMQDADFDVDDGPVNLGKLLARPFPTLLELVPDWIEANINTFLEGPAQSMKSLSALQDAICISAKHPVFDRKVIKTRALYLSYEEPADEIQRRAEKIRSRIDIDVSGVQIWDLKTHPRAILQVKANGDVWLTRFGSRFLAHLAARKDEGTLVVFDGIIDAITFEGSTRNSDVVAGQVIREIDRWCIEYNFTALSILHPSRAGEREGGGSYAYAWTSKPRALHTFKRLRIDGGAVNEHTPPQHTMVRRTVKKRSHGAFGHWQDLRYERGTAMPLDVGSLTMSPEDAAVKVVSDITNGDRINRYRKLGGAKLSNDHWLAKAFGRLIGTKGTVEGLMAALDSAQKDGRLVYEGHTGGRKQRAAGYAIAPDEEAGEKSEVEEEIF